MLLRPGCPAGSARLGLRGDGRQPGARPAGVAPLASGASGHPGAGIGHTLPAAGPARSFPPPLRRGGRPARIPALYRPPRRGPRFPIYRGPTPHSPSGRASDLRNLGRRPNTGRCLPPTRGLLPGRVGLGCWRPPGSAPLAQSPPRPCVRPAGDWAGRGESWAQLSGAGGSSGPEAIGGGPEGGAGLGIPRPGRPEKLGSPGVSPVADRAFSASSVSAAGFGSHYPPANILFWKQPEEPPARPKATSGRWRKAQHPGLARPVFPSYAQCISFTEHQVVPGIVLGAENRAAVGNNSRTSVSCGKM